MKANVTARTHQGTSAVQHTRVRRILIVEDDSQIAALLAVHLGAAGYQTVQVEDASAAISAAYDGVFDLVLMDILLPGRIDGIDATEMIQQHFDIPVIFLSAVNPERILDRVVASAPYGYIRKPWSPETLHVSVELALEKHRVESLHEEQEKQLRRLNHALRLIHDCNVALVRAESEADIVKRIVDLLHQQGGYAAVWLDVVGTDGKLTDEPVAAVVAAELVGLRWFAGFRERCSLPAFATLEAVDCVFESEKMASGWVHDLAGRGQHAGIALPVICRNTSIGVLNLLASTPEEFDADAIEVLTELADDLAYGILAQRESVERKRAEAGERLLIRAVEASANGIMITDAVAYDHPITYVNRAFERITGYAAAEVVGQNGRLLLGGQFDQPELDELRQALREGRETKVELQNYRKGGTLFPVELTVSPVLTPDGAIGHFVSIFNDISERKRYETELEHRANHDSLTGLANRNLLRDRLHQAIAYAERHDSLIALLAVDLDQFKRINESLGHTYGDELLVMIAECLADCVREGDTVARLGDDEFVIVLCDPVGEDHVARVIARMLERVAQPIRLGNQELAVSCSIGASLYPRDGTEAEVLLQNADAAMHRAKVTGRGGFHFYEAVMNARATDRLALDTELRHALERGEFEIHYQPQADLRSGEILGAEALLRWRHPLRGLVSPDEFIGLAEETGLIVPIGKWVINAVCTQIRDWRNSGLRAPRVAVNLSARQFQNEELCEQIISALEQAGLDGSVLEFELTESLALEDIERVTAVLKRIKRLGATTALDDFGTGFSSLSYLIHFAVDKIKIDRSFVRDIPNDRTAAAVSMAVIAMAKGLGIKVIAEGVETAAQVAFLREQGCDEMQGYHFSRPLPPGEFAQLM